MTRFTHTLFTDVGRFYRNLYDTLVQAEESIHMVYFAFDDGEWATKIGGVLEQKAADGVCVHLMVDEFGLALDNVRNVLRNRTLLARLKRAGVQVEIFRPSGRRLGQFNRLHAKFCAVDRRTVFLGGSNIGDHYLAMRDSNLRLDGDLGDTFAHLYQQLRGASHSCGEASRVRANYPLGQGSLLLTWPGHRQNIRRALLKLILEAKRSVTIRTWYFLPDQEILNALLSQAERGVDVTVLLSHQTRVPVIDVVNRITGYRLARSSARVYRYCGRYMHGKEAWNDQGQVLFGSANVDNWSLCRNFECNVQFQDLQLAQRLQSALEADRAYCRRQRSANLSGLLLLDAPAGW